MVKPQRRVEYLPLDGNVQVCDVAKRKVNQPLEVVLAQVVFEALTRELFALLQSQEAILREAVFGLVDHIFADLLRHFDQVGAADNSDVNALRHERVQRLDHNRLDGLPRGRQRLVDVEEHNNPFGAFHNIDQISICSSNHIFASHSR